MLVLTGSVTERRVGNDGYERTAFRGILSREHRGSLVK